MAKKRRRHGGPTAASPTRRDNEDRRKARALIISALAAGGVFQLNGWQVQAHGNRSSHAVAAFQTPVFSTNDFVLMRQTLTAPNVNETTQLAQVTEQLRNATSTTDVTALNQLRAQLEDQLRTRTTTRQAIEFLHQGDSAAAVAAIEGEGWPERVLGEYLWALLDIAYLGRQGTAFTATQMNEFMSIARAANDYSNRMLAALPANDLTPQELAVKERIAEVLHNTASFTLPDDGTVSAADLAFGRAAAEQALQLRQELGKAAQIMRAHWMVGNHYLRAGNTVTAQQHLSLAAQQAEYLGDQPGLAWSKAYLAKAVRPTDPAAATVLSDAAHAIADAITAPDVTIEFLRQEWQREASSQP